MASFASIRHPPALVGSRELRDSFCFFRLSGSSKHDLHRGRASLPAHAGDQGTDLFPSFTGIARTDGLEVRGPRAVDELKSEGVHHQLLARFFRLASSTTSP